LLLLLCSPRRPASSPVAACTDKGKQPPAHKESSWGFMQYFQEFNKEDETEGECFGAPARTTRK
jgi:hypothetical protein